MSKAKQKFDAAMVQFVGQNYHKSIDLFSEAIASDPEFQLAFKSRGAAHLRLGRIQDALADFNRVLELDPNSTRALHLRGLAHEKAGDYAKAIADLSKAIEINPQYGAAYYSRANLYSKTGKTAQAAEDIEMVTHRYCRNSPKIIQTGLIVNKKKKVWVLSANSGSHKFVKAMVLNRLTTIAENKEPLALVDMPEPVPEDNEILIKVSTCGVCHTELDEIEGRTPPLKLPVVPGHQIVGRVAAGGDGVKKFGVGDRVGVAWIHHACGRCYLCTRGAENLCASFKATGRDVHGGYAEYMTVDENFAYPIPEVFTDLQAAPLLCAGAIGYRSMQLSGIKEEQNLGLTGFGASAHLVLKMVHHKWPNTKIFVFARSKQEREFARQLGAVWAGDTAVQPPEMLDAIIDTTPAWKPIVKALKCLKPGGRLIINAIRKEESDKKALLKLDYAEHLWQEKEIKSVANVARADVSEFLSLAADIPIKPEVQEFKLQDANRALVELKQRNIRGAKVLKIN